MTMRITWLRVMVALLGICVIGGSIILKVYLARPLPIDIAACKIIDDFVIQFSFAGEHNNTYTRLELRRLGGDLQVLAWEDHRAGTWDLMSTSGTMRLLYGGDPIGRVIDRNGRPLTCTKYQPKPGAVF